MLPKSPIASLVLELVRFISRRSVEEIHDDGTPTTKTFEHVQSEIGAEEAEEVTFIRILLLEFKEARCYTQESQTWEIMGTERRSSRKLELQY